MTGKDLFREIGMIDEKYVVEAEEVKRPVRFNPMLKKSLATVACLCICIGLYFGVRQLDIGVGGESTANSTADAVGQSAGYDGSMAASNGAWQESESFFDEMSIAATTEAYKTAEDCEVVEKDENSELLQDNKQENEQNEADSQMGDANIAESVQSDRTVIETSRDFEEISERFAGYSDVFEPDTGEVDVINRHGELQPGSAALEDFLAKTESGADAAIELVQFTIEGDPIFYYIQYNGKDFYMVMDARRDAFAGDKQMEEGVYSNLQVYEEMLEDGLYNVIWVLTNQENVTLEELEQGKVEGFTVIQYIQER